jgi:hypothetical protein
VAVATAGQGQEAEGTMMDWSVHVATAGPASSPPLTEDELDVFTVCLDTYSPAVTGSAAPEQPRGWSVQLAIEDAASAEDAAQRGTSAALQAAQKAGLPAWPVVKVEATRWDIFEAEVDRPNYPELVGVAELAELCRVSRQRASTLARHSSFPEPLAELASGPVWDLRVVERFVRDWPRRPGRPAKSTSTATVIAAQQVFARAARQSAAAAKAAASGRYAARSAKTGKSTNRGANRNAASKNTRRD